MLEYRKKPRTEAACFIGPAKKVQELREYAAKLGIQESVTSIPWRDTFTEFQGNEAGNSQHWLLPNAKSARRQVLNALLYLRRAGSMV